MIDTGNNSFRPIHGGNRQWAADLIGKKPEQLLDFSASINPLGPPQSAIEAIKHNLSSITHYPDPEYKELRQALANFYHLEPQWILPGNGVSELLTPIGRELGALESTIVFTPAFSDYKRAISAFSGTIETLSFLLDHPLKQLNQIQNPDRKGLLLNNPHNPTGKLLSKADISPHLDRFGLVVIDEAFMDFLPPDREQSCLDLVEAHPNLVILRSLTKFYSLPGLRLGCAIAHPDRLRKWQQWRDPWSVNSLAVAAGIAVVKDKIFQQQTWDWLSVNLSNLFDQILNIPGLIPLPSSANYLLVKTALPGSDLQYALLQTSGILIRDCLSFKELADRYVRVAVRTETENKLLIDSLAAQFGIVNQIDP